MVQFEITAGDLFDRTSIFQIKATKTKKFLYDFNSAREKVKRKIDEHPLSIIAYESLVKINTDLWDVEDDIREAISQGDVDGVYQLSKRVIKLNDERSRVKKQIDSLFGDVGDSKFYSGENGYSV